MTAITNIVVNDAAATPVAHTFAPAKAEADYALLEDRAGGYYVGYNKLSFRLTRPKGLTGNARNLKLNIKIETPKLETLGTNSAGITPPPTVAYRPVAELVVTLPERSSLQDRKDLLAFVKNVLANATTTLAFEQYELPY